MQDLEKAIKTIGLSDKEAKVYLSMVELGKGTVQMISKKAEVNRATTYVIIESLIQLGLVNSSQVGKKRFFSSTSPDVFLQIVANDKKRLNEREEAAMEVVNGLKLLTGYSDNHPKMAVYEGENGTNEIRRILSKSEDNEMLEFFPADLALERFPISDNDHRDQFDRFDCKIIYTSKKGEIFSDRAGRQYACISADDFPFTSDVTITGKYISIVNYRPRLLGVLISNQSMAETFKSMFSLMWIGAKNKKKA